MDITSKNEHLRPCFTAFKRPGLRCLNTRREAFKIRNQ